jgi:carboxyl-terminal processing protease
MLKNPLIIILALMSIASSAGSGQTPTAKEISPAAKAYLEAALNLIQENSVHKKSVDWNLVRPRVLKAAAGAEVPADTYEAIRLALRELKDSHSSLELSKELKDLEASRKPTRIDPNRFPLVRSPPPVDVQRGPEGYMHKVGGQVVARVVAPAYDAAAEDSSATQLRATQLQKVIADLDTNNPCGWIIDLRGNTNYDLWPMLAGIGPILGDGVVGGFRDADGNLVKWFYHDGKSGIRDLLGVEHSQASVTGKPYRSKNSALIAVLVDRKTTNSAEAIAVTLKGRPMTRFFGEPISITSIQRFPLSDGANLVLTVGVYVDRAGGEYADGLNPDELIPLTGRNPRAGEDAVIHAALGWIGEQSECTGRPSPSP